MKPSALLIGVVAVAAVAGVAISTAQRPPAPKPPPTPTPSPVPTPIPAGPVSGSGFSIADDPSSGQIVLFGGVDNYANTWLWAGGRWTLANPSLSPPGRIDAAEAYDPSTQQVLLFGGRHNPFGNGAPLNDTWAWNGASWIEVDNGTGGPTPGEGSSMAWDPALREMVLVTSAGNASGGDATWVWFGAHWQNQPHGAVAPNAFDLPMAYDPVTRSLIAEGCCSTPVSPLGALDTTWQWNGESLAPTRRNRGTTARLIHGTRPSRRSTRPLQLRAGAVPPRACVMDRTRMGRHDCRQAPRPTSR